MKPVTRIEQLISAIIENDVTPPSAVTRIEKYLEDIYNGTASTLAPVTRVETYLAKISGADVDIPTPVTRLEIYLAAIAGDDVDMPTPVSHLEYFLAEWANGVLKTVTGNAPLTLANAVERAIKILTQTGLCTQASTPTPSAPVAIKCNNGEIKFGKPLTIDSTRISAYIGQTGTWVASNEGYSVVVPVEVGQKYAIRMTETDSGTVGTIFRYGFTDSATPESQQLTQWVRTTPQDTQYVELTADGKYLIIQMTYGKFASIISNGYIVVKEQTIYVDGTPEVLTVTDADSNTQTASVEDLFAKDTYADTQDIISGIVTRKAGVMALDGTEAWTDITGIDNVYFARIADMMKPSNNIAGQSTHYVGTNFAHGNMPDNSIKYVSSGSYGAVVIKDTAQATKADLSAYLAAQYAAGTPVIIVYNAKDQTTEQVAAQPLTTAAGTNTVSVTAEVSPIELECEYYKQSY